MVSTLERPTNRGGRPRWPAKCTRCRKKSRPRGPDCDGWSGGDATDAAAGGGERPRVEVRHEPPPTATGPLLVAHETTVRATAMLHPPWVCSCASNGAFVPEKPPVTSLDSSGAIGGVLELPGDDYFIYGRGAVQGRSTL
jgi:hypothetical protein